MEDRRAGPGIRRLGTAGAPALRAAGALAVGLLALVACGPERTLYHGGPILTMDSEGRVVEALAVEGERIHAAGSLAELAPWAERHGARRVDLAGRALLPGFVDAHGHFPGTGIYAVVVDLNAPPIGDVRSLDELVAKLADRAAETPTGEWVVGMGYDDTLLAEGRHPTRTDLDRASTEHPIGIWHVSGHLAVANSAALAVLGIDAETPDPEGGRIRRDPQTGRPTGVLEEEAAHGLEALIAEPGPWQSWQIVRAATQDYLSAGVTTAQNGYATPGQMRGLAWLSWLGLLPLRVVLWPSREAALVLLDGELDLDPGDPDRVRLGAGKLLADGSIQGYTGYLREPYHVPPPGEGPGYRGYPRIPPDELAATVSRLHAAGWQVAVHGNGDAAIDAILDAFAAAQRAHPRPDPRHVVVHAQMARDDQLARMATLGVVPSFFVLHTYYWGDRHRERFMGPERAARMSPARSAAAHGLRFTLHADAPVVPMEPLRLIWAAVNRLTRSGAVVGPGQRISVERALRAVTLDAARQHFAEDRTGSLEPGKLADLVLLDRSPLAVPPEQLHQIRVLETIVGGETVWRREEDSRG